MTDSLAKGALALDTFAYWQAALTTSGRAAEVLAPPFRASRVEADEALRRLRRARANSALGRAAETELNLAIWRDHRRTLEIRARLAACPLESA